MRAMIISLATLTKTKDMKKRVVVVAAKTMSMAETTNASTVIKPTLVILLSTLTLNRSTPLVLMESKERHQHRAEAVADPARM
jgi:hypothetical protein